MHQAEMAISAGDSIAFMNQKTRHKLACAVNEVQWHETSKTVEDAITWAMYCEEHNLIDCYVSDNAFKDWRAVTNIRQINRLAVDLDYYNIPELARLEAIELWERIKHEQPWLPDPTIIESSGRGAYLKWKLTRPLPINRQTQRFNFVSQWQICQDFLAEQLKPYGADPKASDVTRVLRVPGTINGKSLHRAQSWTCGPEYEFADLKAVFNQQHKQTRPKPTAKRAVRASQVESLHTWHSLAWKRLKDLERLAELRGGKLTDHRRRAIFIYAVEACHFCRSEGALRSAIERFVDQCIGDATRYHPFNGRKVHIKSVINRFKKQEERGHWEWFEDSNTGKYHKSNRYLLKTATIIDDLEITPAEQKHMKALVGAAEKYRRKVKKRRERGVIERSEYLSKAQQRREEAKRLRGEGLKMAAIAKSLGVGLRTVERYLS